MSALRRALLALFLCFSTVPAARADQVVIPISPSYTANRAFADANGNFSDLFARVANLQAALDGKVGPTDFGTLTTALPGRASAADLVALTGIVGRDLAARFGAIVDVSDAPYNVVCNGSTDVAAALNAAIAAAVPRPVYIPPQAGKCLLSTPLQAKSGLTVYATRGTVTLAPTAGNTANPMLVQGVLLDGVRFLGVGFEGGGKDHANPNPLITAYRVNGFTFDQTDWAHTRGTAVLISNSSRSGVASSAFTDIGNHWITTGNPLDRKAAIAFCCNDAQASTNNFARDNSFVDVGLDAINGTEQTDISATGNKCWWSYVQTSLISATDYPACVYMNGVDGLAVSANTSRRSPGNGIDIINSKRLAVTGNVMTQGGWAGLSLANVSAGAVSGNTLTNNVQWSSSPTKGGIALFDAIASVSISGNVVTDAQSTKTQLYGIYGYAGTTLTDVVYDSTNVLSGNSVAPLGGTLQ